MAPPTKTACDRCGTCCTRGGPALHHEDRWLLQDNRLKLLHLITIRKGEPVLNLAREKPEPAQSEIVKIRGCGTEWTCIFFREKTAECSIYTHRPLECSLLKCWDPGDLEEIGGRNLLSRHDIIAMHDPVLPFIRNHDNSCSLENLPCLIAAVRSQDTQRQALADLTRLVQADLAIRAQAWARFRFDLDHELFYFGRPLFKILEQYKIETHYDNNNAATLKLNTGTAP